MKTGESSVDGLTGAVPRHLRFWEVWLQSQGEIKKLQFDSEEEARRYFNRIQWSCVLFAPGGNAASKRSGLFDMKKVGITAIMEERERVTVDDLARAGSEHHEWTVGAHVDGGVQMESFPNEALAREKYEKLQHSKVLFSEDRIPLQCSTAPLDRNGEGVAAVLRHQQSSGELDMSVSEAVEAGMLPFVPPDRHPAYQLAVKSVVSNVFNRDIVSYFSCTPLRNRSLCFYDAERYRGVEGCVALTVDDAPCPLGRENSMLHEVLSLLKERDAKVTFMLVGKNAEGHEEDLLELLRDGHELANHGMLDRPYHEDSREDFVRAVTGCSNKIRELQREAGVEEGVNWFRAPHAKYTETMEDVLTEQGLANVMCDCYAACPVIQDGAFIGDQLAKSAKPGSILVIHMPARGVREWCYEGISHALEGLEMRGLRSVTVSELRRRAEEAGTTAMLQWMWDESPSLPLQLQTLTARLQTLAQKNPLSWSAQRAAENVAAELDGQTANRAVRVRLAGAQSSRAFPDAGHAAIWIRAGLDVGKDYFARQLEDDSAT